MIRGITFDKQLMQSADHAHEVNYYYNGDLGVTKGCTVAENVDGNLVVSSGYFIVKGRLIAVDGSEIITVPSVASGTLYSTLVFEIDLTQVNTLTEFNQGSFKIVSSAVAYPTLTQQDLDNGGTLYQFEFVRFENTVGGIVGLTDTRVLLNLGKYALKNDLMIKNAIINGGFQVNQRAKSGTVVLTAGQYGHDRWKAGASGCTYTFATVENITTITISAGSLIQVIEGLNLETGTYCLSWVGTAQGKIGGGSFGASGVVGTAVGGTNLNIEFGTGTLSKVCLVKGTIPVECQNQPYADVLRECQRYYWRMSGSTNYAVYGMGIGKTSTETNFMIPYLVAMRTSTPIVTFSSLGITDVTNAILAVSGILLPTGNASNATANLDVVHSAGGTAYRPYRLLGNNSASSFLAFDCEL